MTTDDKRAILRDHYLFQNLTPQHIDRISACMVTKTVERGTNIWAKGEPGTSLCAIGAGTVKISIPSVDGKSVLFNVLGEGAIIGEIALLDGKPRAADATAVTDCELFVIERRDFLPLMREDPEIGIKIIETLCSKLRRTTEQAEEKIMLEKIMFLDLPSRLAKVLMRLLKATGTPPGTSERRIPITHEDLGNLVGVTRESVTKQLRIWEDKKWVRLERDGVVILAPDRLAAIADSDTHDG
jgi:CRP/FNR family cyclic AMP-dependent transcriptional regulator